MLHLIINQFLLALDVLEHVLALLDSEAHIRWEQL